MLIQNYDNRSFDLADRLEAQGKSEWFIAGAAAGAHGRDPSPPLPPKPATLKVTQKEDRVIISGDTYPYREALKRHGGAWYAAERAWVFRPEALPALKEDEELVGEPWLFEDRPGLEGEALALARADYEQGYVYGQQHRYQAPIGTVFAGRRPMHHANNKTHG